MGRNMNKKSDSMYLNLWDYWDTRYPFQIFIGAYGAGKSYSALKGAVEREVPFIYMRRTKEAFNTCCSTKTGDAGNPFTPLNDDLGWDIGIYKQNEKIAEIYHRERDDKGFPVPTGLPIGTAIYLGGIAKARGAGLERAELIIYDEFIKEAHEPRMKEEFRALNRGYETINRNKELKGKPPTCLWMISNAEDIYNPIFQGYGIVSDCERMARKGQEHKYYPERGLAVHLLHSSEEFLKRKSETAIMRLMKGTSYAKVGLENQFANQDYGNVKYMDTTGFRPIACLDFAYIYRKKGENIWYVSYKPAQCLSYSARNDADEMLFRRTVGVGLQKPYMRGEIYFESYELKAFLLEHML